VPDADRRRISSGAPWERSVGYSRAMVVGRHVFVSGTAPVMPDGSAPPTDAYAQAKRCLEIVESALAEAGASFSDVVRTRLYLTTLDAFEGVGRAHAEAFADVRPASAAVVVAGLVDPRWLVEIEVDAILPPEA